MVLLEVGREVLVLFSDELSVVVARVFLLAVSCRLFLYEQSAERLFYRLSYCQLRRWRGLWLRLETEIFTPGVVMLVHFVYKAL